MAIAKQWLQVTVLANPTTGLSEDAKKEIAEVIKRHGGDVKSIDNPTATMEDLFLNIVRESEARPGARRVSSGGASSSDSGGADQASSDDGEAGQ